MLSYKWFIGCADFEKIPEVRFRFFKTKLAIGTETDFSAGINCYLFYLIYV
jgi:hypothetical protein